MAKVTGAIEVNRERCKGCELCKVACPKNVLDMSHEVNAKGYHYSFMKNPENCIGCAMCANVCPDSVIEVYRMRVTEDVAMA